MTTHLATRLRELSPTRASLPQARELVWDGRGGRLTPLEHRALSDYLLRHRGELVPELARWWTEQLATATVGYAPVRPIVRQAPAPEDVSRTGGTFWMHSLDGDPAQRALVVDMIGVGRREGFRIGLHLSKSKSTSQAIAAIAAELGATPRDLERDLIVVGAGGFGSVWAQDHGWFTADGRELRVAPMLGERSRRRAKAFQAEHGYHRVSDSGYLGLMGEDWSSAGLARLGDRLGLATRELSVYVEGGDLLVGTHADGRPYALLGRDSLVLATFALDEGDVLDAGAVAELARGPFGETRVADTRRGLGRVLRRRCSTATAREFLAKLELTSRLIADELAVPPPDLHVVTQPDAHLDQAMMLIGPGEVALNDHGAWLPIFDAILARDDLGREDRVDLGQLGQETARLHELTAPVLSTVEAELTAAGLHVTRIAGATGRCVPDPSPDDIDWVTEIDFVNSIGVLGGDGAPVCITNASHLPGVQEAFEAQMRERFGFARVHFVGGAPVSDDLRVFGHNYAEISRRSDGGVLCRTLWQPECAG